MLRVAKLSGDEVASIPIEQLSDVKTLKQRLHQQHGLPPRFRQRLLHEGKTLDDAVKLDSVVDLQVAASMASDASEKERTELQVVTLPLAEASEDQPRELWEAAADGLVAEVEALLQFPLDPDLELVHSFISPLMKASINGHVDVARLLLEAGAQANFHGGSVWGDSPLMAAANRGHSQVVELLLEAKAETDFADTENCTALIFAAFYGRVEAARLLLEAGAQTELRSQDGRTALIDAARQGHRPVVKLLLGAGAQLEARDAEGNTALMAAASEGHASVVELLLEGGAHRDARDDQGSTALMKSRNDEVRLEASLEVELPSLCLRGTSSVPLLASLLGGLDAAAPVVGPPRSVRQLQERQFYGAKWDLDEYFSADSGQDGSKIYCKHHSVLYRSCGVSDFDYRYFGIPAQDAREMDPRCRLLLEGHEAALRAAGQRSSQERSYGVFSGLSGLGSRAASNPSLIVGQVAEFLNLTGTTMNLDTGDASSLMAVERAVVSVRKGECVAALASSVHWITGPAEALAMCRQRLLAPSGRTRSFDASADGFLPGEGAVVCLLGSPSGTRAGGDRGSIVGVGSKFSGKAASLKAPHAPSVSEVLAKAARDGALPLATLDAVEASAGGQASSDAEELALLRRALRHRDESRPVVVSCIKASFGNAGVAGGLLGIARSLILLGRGLHGPQLHLHTLALEPPEDETGTRRSLHIPTEVLAGGRLASQIIGVSSFAATGYCAHHLVLAEPPVIPSKASQGQHPLWWPYKLMEKDRTLVYRGYFLQGTMTAWSEGLPMTRVNEEDELDTFEGYIGLESDFPETFQIWVDDDPDKALHPPQRGDPAEAAVIGPSSAAPRSLCWKIGEDGRAGDGYRIRLQVNGSLRRLSWKKMPKERSF
eukprot:s807_g7.t1